MALALIDERSEEAEPRAPRTIVLCCDGTNNEPEHPDTNVVRLYRILDKCDPSAQIVFYDPGVGTFAQPGLVSPLAKKISEGLGLAFGVGFTDNLEQTYGFLVEHYRPGDRICLFGFSRGAFTARAVAGMIHMCGILRPTHAALIPYVSRIYQGAKFGAAENVRRTYSWSYEDLGDADADADFRPAIDFLGLWDTVASVGIFYKRKTLPYTTKNISVRKTRQALGIDERRAYFQPKCWRAKGDRQDNRQVWFAGVHADVGGGYPAEERGLARTTLMWMLQELLPGFEPDGPDSSEWPVRILRDEYREEVLGECPDAPAFDTNGLRHRSLRGAWWALEGVPMNYEVDRSAWFIPLAQRRRPWAGDRLHASVVERRDGTTYAPIAEFEELRVEQWPEWYTPGSEDASRQAAGVGDGGAAEAERVARLSPLAIGVAVVAAPIVFYTFWSVVLGMGNALLALGSAVPEFTLPRGAVAPGEGESLVLSWVWRWISIPAPALAPMADAFVEAWDWPLATGPRVRQVAAVLTGLTRGDLGPASAFLGPMVPLLAALFTILASGAATDRFSGLRKYRQRIVGSWLYVRAFGYSVHEIAQQMYQLRQRSGDQELPRSAFRRALNYDNLSPLLYVPVFVLSLRALPGTGALPAWIVVGLPVVAALADWIENTTLIRVIDTYNEWKNPPSYAVAVDKLTRARGGDMLAARLATAIKSLALGLALLILAAPAAASVQTIAALVVALLAAALLVLGARALVRGLSGS